MGKKKLNGEQELIYLYVSTMRQLTLSYPKCKCVIHLEPSSYNYIKFG
jgi:hypothetical protein